MYDSTDPFDPCNVARMFIPNAYGYGPLKIVTKHTECVINLIKVCPDCKTDLTEEYNAHYLTEEYLRKMEGNDELQK